MLVEVMEIEMFVNMLLPVKRCRKAGNGSQFIGTAERALTFFEVFDANTLNKKRVPLALTCTIVCMTVKCRHNATEMKGNCFIPKRFRSVIMKAHIMSYPRHMSDLKSWSNRLVIERGYFIL